MTEEEVRERAVAVCDALVGGDVERVIGMLSEELRRNPGEVVAMLPLPALEATVASIEGASGGAAYVAVLDVTSESECVELQTRWKARNGEPRIVEVSHLSRVEHLEEAPAAEDAEGTTEDAT